MSEYLVGGSAVDRRRDARMSIAIALGVALVSLPLSDNILGMIGIGYAIYKGIFRGILMLWVYKE